MRKPRFGLTKEKLFWKKVVKKEGGCWLWFGAVSPQGYGMFCSGYGAKGVGLAHRYAYTLLKGPIPDLMTLDHTCDNKLCVNPDHLLVCSQKENVQRYHQRRRQQRDATRTSCNG